MGEKKKLFVKFLECLGEIEKKILTKSSGRFFFFSSIKNLMTRDNCYSYTNNMKKKNKNKLVR